MTVKASFDTTTKDGAKKVFNAKNGASVSLKSLKPGETIQINAILLHEDTIESYGKPQDVTITTLFGTDGVTYAGVSDTISRGADELIDYMKATGDENVEIQIVKGTSKGGNEFLNLQLV